MPVALVGHWVDDSEWDGQEAAVLLRIGRGEAASLPEFHERDFALPRPGWQPPVDYRREGVRVAAGTGFEARTS